MAMSAIQKAKEDLSAGHFWCSKCVRWWLPLLVVVVTLTTIASVSETYKGFTDDALLAFGGIGYFRVRA